MRHFAGRPGGRCRPARACSAARPCAQRLALCSPGRFIRVRDAQMRGRIHALVEEERAHRPSLGAREADFKAAQGAGCAAGGRGAGGAMPPGREAHVFGRRTLPEMDVATPPCAIQNRGWRRVRGLGMGWVSLSNARRWRSCWPKPAGAHTRWPVLCWPL
ncbi:hypothetical protein [Comamonas sp. JC664]|uniref:hypothetical protein n=1 Tax=Comamonas sp. JC664 TaxID=2801917 RepID=UPI003622191F